jgi:hypothetical protein
MLLLNNVWNGRKFLNVQRLALKQLGAFFDGTKNNTQKSIANKTACVDQSRCEHAQNTFAEENPGFSYFTVDEAIPWSHSTKSAITQYVDRPSSLIASRANAAHHFGLIESIKLAELSERRSRRAKIVGFVVPVAVAHRHAAEQHLIRRQLQEITNGVIKPGPGLPGGRYQGPPGTPARGYSRRDRPIARVRAGGRWS